MNTGPNGRLKVFAERRPYRGQVALFVASELNGRLSRMEVTFVAVPEYQHVTDPALVLEQSEAQLFMDELWSAGLRPSEGAGSAGAMAATERHLSDMREIAMGLLKGVF